MSKDRMRVKLTLVGLALSALLFLGFFFFMSNSAPPPTLPEDTASNTAATIPWILIMNLVLVVVVGIGAAFWARGESQKRKRKRDDSEADDYLRDMVEDGAIHLADDGELPELYEDDEFGDEKPKRSEDDW